MSFDQLLRSCCSGRQELRLPHLRRGLLGCSKSAGEFECQRSLSWGSGAALAPAIATATLAAAALATALAAAAAALAAALWAALAAATPRVRALARRARGGEGEVRFSFYRPSSSAGGLTHPHWRDRKSLQ